jgi:HTH-type transcriptional regulator / antitoxin MqsA
MPTCNVCGCPESHIEYVSEVFNINGRHVLIERIPAQVCNQCGELTFSRATTEQVRLMVHGDAQPIGTVQMDIFAFA